MLVRTVLTWAWQLLLFAQVLVKRNVSWAHRIACSARILSISAEAGVLVVTSGARLVSIFLLEDFVDVNFLHGVTTDTKAVLMS